MTDLQSAMQAAYEATFGKDTLGLATGGKAFPVRPDALTDTQIAAFFRYGKRALNDSYNNDAKKLKDEGKDAPDPEAYKVAWLAKFGTKATKERTPAGSIEDRADKQYFAKKHSAKFGKQWTLEDQWLSATAALLISEGEANTPEAALAMAKADASLIAIAKDYHRATDDWATAKAFVEMDGKKPEPEEVKKLGLFKKA